jgi:hypothetical protein
MYIATGNNVSVLPVTEDRLFIRCSMSKQWAKAATFSQKIFVRLIVKPILGEDPGENVHTRRCFPILQLLSTSFDLLLIVR